jgi:pimeloyl-ACP methyl ester carboxylesterase
MTKPQFLGDLAYHHIPGTLPGVLWLGGFRSDMSGTKAVHLEKFCQDGGQQFTRFDYRGHGQSGGRFEDLTLSGWLGDATAVLDRVTSGPQVLVGSSMGGWLALLLAQKRKERVHSLVLLAPAPDFTRDIRAQLSEENKNALIKDGFFEAPSAYGPPYQITAQLLEDGENHILLDGDTGITCPVTILHGQADPDVPWKKSVRLKECLPQAQVNINFIPDGDHRLSRSQDLDALTAAVARSIA